MPAAQVKRRIGKHWVVLKISVASGNWFVRFAETGPMRSGCAYNNR
jgi:hypothetical protein